MASLGTTAYTGENYKNIAITAHVNVSVVDLSWTQSKIVFTFSTTGSGRVWNHGILVQVTCNGTTKPNATLLSYDNALIGCKKGWVATSDYLSPTSGSLVVEFIVNKDSTSKSISYSVIAHSAKNAVTDTDNILKFDSRNSSSLMGTYNGTATISGKITEIGTGTTTITDNYNNTFTITATKGANGTNNTAGGPDTLKWGYDTNYSNTYTNGNPNTLTISGTGKTRRVYAKSRTTATYGNHKEATTSKDIRQYVEIGRASCRERVCCAV